MNRILKISRGFVAAMIIGTITTNCSNDEENVALSQQRNQVTTRSIGVKTPKITVYIETNDINPLNAGEYYFSDTEEEVIDHVILFASNIRGNATSAWLHHNPNQTHILNNVDSLIRPLQQKGIKVLLGLLGDHTGVSFANLPPLLMEDFAQQVADCVDSYGLDGVDIGNEYGNYACAPAGFPDPSPTILGYLIVRLRQLLPDKLVTAFRFGYLSHLDTAAVNTFDYMWPNYGCNTTSPSQFPKSKWAKLSMRIFNEGGVTPSPVIIQNCAINYASYGAVMMFNMREWDTSGIMNRFAPRIWGIGTTVSWSGVSYSKNYP